MAFLIPFKQLMCTLETILRTWRSGFVSQKVVHLVNKTDCLEHILCSNLMTEVQVAKHGLQLNSNPIESLTSSSYHLISIRDIPLNRYGTQTHSDRFRLVEHAVHSIDSNGGGLDSTLQGGNLILHVVSPSNHVALKEVQPSFKSSQPTRHISITREYLTHNGVEGLLRLSQSRLGKKLE
jgi:hypothetical protein